MISLGKDGMIIIHTIWTSEDLFYVLSGINNVIIEACGNAELSAEGREGIIVLLRLSNTLLPDEKQFLRLLDKPPA